MKKNTEQIKISFLYAMFSIDTEVVSIHKNSIKDLIHLVNSIINILVPNSISPVSNDSQIITDQLHLLISLLQVRQVMNFIISSAKLHPEYPCTISLTFSGFISLTFSGFLNLRTDLDFISLVVFPFHMERMFLHPRYCEVNMMSLSTSC